MPNVFISYSHKDETWKDRLQTQLAVLEMEGLLSVWEDRQIDLGDDWYPEIEAALNTSDVAILLISADFLTSKFIRGEEIPRLLKRREQEGIRVIPLIIKPCLWQKVPWLSAIQGASKDNVELSGLSEHQQDAILCKLAEQVHDLLEEAKQKSQNTTTTSASNIKIDRLPTVIGKFCGRKKELKLLNDAWANDTTNIIQFIAPGGTGKTKLLRYWLDRVRPEKLIAWSFYSQGSSEEKQPTATLFYNRVFELLDPSKTVTDFANQPEKMGEYLAELLRQQNCLLVLDGFEPLQHSSAVVRGELKDRTLRTLLKSLAAHHSSLCIITTRIAIRELGSYSEPVVISHDLQNLDEQDGINLLKSLHVTGSDKALRTAVNEYGRHALALHLLGNALTSYLDGDVLKRDTLDDLLGEEAYTDVERHAFKVMQAYKKWLQDTPEVQLLYLLGLFDHPIESEVLEVLWKAKIPSLTDKISPKTWKVAVHDLREKHRLLSTHEGRPNLLDCHPLIREYFGNQLKHNQPKTWQQAHKKLYEYYKGLPKTYPDTLEEMRPLFHAVTHGCAAGLHQRVVTEVYYSRIERKEEFYNVKKLGAFNDDLAAIACFFTEVWQKPSTKLPNIWQLRLLGYAGFCLRALGRLHEALEPMTANVALAVAQKNWKEASIGANNLGELQLTLGNVTQAVKNSELSSRYADQSGNMLWRSAARTTYANALHQLGDSTTALTLFQDAEKLQQEWRSFEPYLYSVQGFRYCTLLLAQGSTAETLERAEYSIKIAKRNQWLLDIALNQLSIGQAYWQQGNTQQATYWLERTVAEFRTAGNQDELPRGLLARAALHRHCGDFARARQDLQEVFDIAEPSGMRLHLTDYHLEMARLLLTEKETPPNLPLPGEEQGASATALQERPSPDKGRLGGVSSWVYPEQTELSFADHVNAAAKLIEETGYHRRDKELAELQAVLKSHTES
jgi:tetratricopeptide (TPR) repeat protein